MGQREARSDKVKRKKRKARSGVKVGACQSRCLHESRVLSDLLPACRLAERAYTLDSRDDKRSAVIHLATDRPLSGRNYLTDLSACQDSDVPPLLCSIRKLHSGLCEATQRLFDRATDIEEVCRGLRQQDRRLYIENHTFPNLGVETQLIRRLSRTFWKQLPPAVGGPRAV